MKKHTDEADVGTRVMVGCQVLRLRGVTTRRSQMYGDTLALRRWCLLMVEVFEIKKPGLVVHLDWTHFDSDVWWMPNINKPFKQMDLAAVPDTAPNMAFMELCWVFSISLFCVLLFYKLSIGEFKYGDTKAIPTKQQWWLRDRKCPTEID